MNILKIKKRINNLKNIHKISNTLFSISLIKLKKYKKELSDNSYFDSLINNTIKKNDNVINENNKQKQLFIVITSNIGFCGSYNKDIINYAHKKIQKNDLVLAIGEKGFNLIKKLEYNCIDEFVLYDGDFLFLSKEITFFILKNKFQKINIIFSKNLNLISNVICHKQISLDNININNDNNLLIIEPNENDLLKEIIPFLLTNNIYKTILTSKISEQIIRINTMQKARQNTKDMINNLENEYNKLRHLKITQEILESSSTTQEG